MAEAKTQGAVEAMEVAEEARESQWTSPSFCAELFSGNFNFNLVYPFPEQSFEEKKIGDQYLEKILSFLFPQFGQRSC